MPNHEFKICVAGKDPVFRLIMENGWKRLSIIIILAYFIGILPIFFSIINGDFVNHTIKIDALHDTGYHNQIFFLFPFIIWFSYYYFYPLEKSLKLIRKRGIVKMTDKEYFIFVKKINNKFKEPVISYFPYLISFMIMIFLAFSYWFAGIGTWNSPQKSRFSNLPTLFTILPAYLLYYMIVAFVFRVAGVYYIVKNFLSHEVKIQPLHPDKCGGLSPLGNFSLRISVAGVIVGISVLFGVFTNIYQYNQNVYSPPNILMFSGYIVGLAIVFFIPLLAANKGMKAAKGRTLQLISDKFNSVMDIAMKMDNENDSRKQMEYIQNLEHLYNLAKKMPVYPFNTANIMKFLYSVFWPLILIFLQSYISKSI